MSAKKPRDRVPVSILMPVPLQQALIEKAKQEDLTFSQVVRRALTKEFGRKRLGNQHTTT
jgi:hypothetical protein